METGLSGYPQLYPWPGCSWACVMWPFIKTPSSCPGVLWPGTLLNKSLPVALPPSWSASCSFTGLEREMPQSHCQMTEVGFNSNISKTKFFPNKWGVYKLSHLKTTWGSFKTTKLWAWPWKSPDTMTTWFPGSCWHPARVEVSHTPVPMHCTPTCTPLVQESLWCWNC